MESRDELSKLTVVELRQYAKSMNLRSYSNKKKNDLIEIILDHLEKTPKSPINNKITEKSDNAEHMKLHKRTFKNVEEIDDYIIEETDEALEKCFLTLRLSPKNKVISVYVLMDELPQLMLQRLKDILLDKKGIKLQVVITGEFKKFNPATGREDFDKLTVASKNNIILREDEIKGVIKDPLNEIHEKIESWDNNEGYWHLAYVKHIDFKLREYKPLTGSSYIPTPKWISNKKATINIKNDDQKCFKYCLVYHKHKNEIKKNPQEMYHYKKWEYLQEFSFETIKFPVEVYDIKKFCKQNDISVNIYVVNGGEIVPYLTYAQELKKSDHVNLLLLEEDEKMHYVYIQNMSKLVRDQLTKNKNQHFICDRCFYNTNNVEVFKRHQEFCDKYLENESAVPILPEEGSNILKFENIRKTIRVPLVYYADLEAVLRKLKHSKFKARHEACAYSFSAFGVKNFYNYFTKYTGKSAKDTMNNFVKALKEEGKKLSEILKERIQKFKKHNLSCEEEEKFKDANVFQDAISVKSSLLMMI